MHQLYLDFKKYLREFGKEVLEISHPVKLSVQANKAIDYTQEQMKNSQVKKIQKEKSPLDPTKTAGPASTFGGTNVDDVMYTKDK